MLSKRGLSMVWTLLFPEALLSTLLFLATHIAAPRLAAANVGVANYENLEGIIEIGR